MVSWWACCSLEVCATLAASAFLTAVAWITSASLVEAAWVASALPSAVVEWASISLMASEVLVSFLVMANLHLRYQLLPMGIYRGLEGE